MALTFYWRCEGTTLDATNDYNANLPTEAATVDAAPAINATAAKYGSNGVEINAAEGYRFDAATTNVNRLTGSVGFWVNVQTWLNARAFLFISGSFFEYSIGVQMVNDTEIRLRINDQSATLASSFDTTAASMATATWYFVTASWDQPNNKRRIRVYNSAKSLIQQVEDTTTAYSAPTDLVLTDGIYIGEGNGLGGALDYYLDNIFIGNAYADADTFLTNADITSYTQYGAGGGGGPTVTWVGYIG
jgi:hypothetical protein